MKKKSLKINAIANSLKTVFSIIFPLITFPYISRVLGVEKYGIYQFSNSIVSYFMYLAMLGISTYAVRTGSGIKNEKKEFNQFANEVFSINIISTFISYIILFICLFFIRKLDFYRISILILSFSIVFTTLGVDWIFTINEDYVYTSIRTICVQIISIILMFIFVKTENDLIKYVIISTFATSGYNLINIFCVRKYCNLKFTFSLNLKKHIIPMLILFANNISIIIYVNSDITLLGIINGDTEVGLYGVSSRIYSIIKQVMNALTVVIIPRVSMLYYKNRIDELKNLINRFYCFLIAILIPSCTGIFMLSKEIISIVSGDEYIYAFNSLKILSISLFFSGIASFFSSAILIPIKKEKKVLISTVFAATINVLGNIFLLNKYGIIGASFTTLISEFLVALILLLNCGELKPKIEKELLIVSIMESLFIIISSLLLKNVINGSILFMFLIMILSLIVFLLLNIVFNTCIGIEIKKLIRKRGHQLC